MGLATRLTERPFFQQIGYGSNRKTRHLMPSGHKAFLVHNTADVDLLLMHNKTFAAEYVTSFHSILASQAGSMISVANHGIPTSRIGHAVSSRKRVEIISRAKELGVKVTNPKARVTTEA